MSVTTVQTTDLHGAVCRGFEGVHEAFVGNFTERGEAGARGRRSAP